jgi:hypothetical protein
MPFHFGVACGCACQNVECEHCDDDEAPRTLLADMSGLLSATELDPCEGCPDLNGLYILEFIGNCQWEYDSGNVDDLFDCGYAHTGRLRILVTITATEIQCQVSLNYDADPFFFLQAFNNETDAPANSGACLLFNELNLGTFTWDLSSDVVCDRLSPPTILLSSP